MTIRNWQALFWMFMFPVVIMSLIGWVLGGSTGGNAKIAFIDKNKSPISKQIVKSFKNIEGIKIENGSDKKKMQSLKDGKINAILIFQKNNLTNSTDKSNSKIIPLDKINVKLLYDPSEAFTSQMIRSTIHSLIGGFEKNISKTPDLFKITEEKTAAKNMRFVDFLLPGIIGMSIMSTAVFGLSSTIVTYREKGILRRLKITPLPLSYFLGARVLVQLVLSIIQTVILIIYGRLAFGVHIVTNIFPLIITVAIGSLCFINIGFLVASIANTTNSADTIANIINMPMMFLSGVFFPIDGAPSWIKPIIKILPLRFLVDSLRDIMIRGKNLGYIQNNLFILLAITIVLFGLAIKLFKWEVKPG